MSKIFYSRDITGIILSIILCLFFAFLAIQVFPSNSFRYNVSSMFSVYFGIIFMLKLFTNRVKYIELKEEELTINWVTPIGKKYVEIPYGLIDITEICRSPIWVKPGTTYYFWREQEDRDVVKIKFKESIGQKFIELHSKFKKQLIEFHPFYLSDNGKELYILLEPKEGYFELKQSIDLMVETFNKALQQTGNSDSILRYTPEASC